MAALHGQLARIVPDQALTPLRGNVVPGGPRRHCGGLHRPVVEQGLCRVIVPGHEQFPFPDIRLEARGLDQVVVRRLNPDQGIALDRHRLIHGDILVDEGRPCVVAVNGQRIAGRDAVERGPAGDRGVRGAVVGLVHDRYSGDRDIPPGDRVILEDGDDPGIVHGLYLQLGPVVARVGGHGAQRRAGALVKEFDILGCHGIARDLVGLVEGRQRDGIQQVRGLDVVPVDIGVRHAEAQGVLGRALVAAIPVGAGDGDRGAVFAALAGVFVLVLAQLRLDGLLVPDLQHLFPRGVAVEVGVRRHVGVVGSVIRREYGVHAFLHGHADGSALIQRAVDIDLVLGGQVDVAGIVVVDHRRAVEAEGAGGHVHAAARIRHVAGNGAADHGEIGVLFGQPDAASQIANDCAAFHAEPAAACHVYGAVGHVQRRAAGFILVGGDVTALDGLGLGVAVDGVVGGDGIALRSVAVRQHQYRAVADGDDGQMIALLIDQPQAVQVQPIYVVFQDNLRHIGVELHVLVAQLQHAAIFHPLAHGVALVVEGRFVIVALARQLGHLFGGFVVEDHGGCPGVIAFDLINDHVIFGRGPVVDRVDVHVVADGQLHGVGADARSRATGLDVYRAVDGNGSGGSAVGVAADARAVFAGRHDNAAVDRDGAEPAAVGLADRRGFVAVG